MEQSDLLRYVAEQIERVGLRYVVTGSMATVYYGEPRFTNDIDVVVDLPAGRVDEFCRGFRAPEFYVSEETARQAVNERGQFNIIHPASGLKIDVIVPQDTPFNHSQFARARRVKLGPDQDVSFASAEDVIIKKMEHYGAGGSEKHLRDITGVLKISGDQVDRDYITEWASRLKLESVWQAILDRTGQ